jgi:DtxR family Mn-dependent transcriptional regulator
MPLILVLSTMLLVAIWAPRVGLAARWRNARQWRHRAFVEDALKYLHAAELRGTPATPESLAGHLRHPLKSILQLLAETEARGLTQTAGTNLTLTPTGREVAVRVIRAHRLLERYFADELRLPLTALQAAADAREHRVTAEEASALAARLGYPTHDPHGDPIPDVNGQLMPVESVLLSRQPVGHPAVILHVEDEPPELFGEVVSAGLFPGMRVEVLEASPTQLVIWNGDREHVLSPLAAASVSVGPMQ